MTVPCCAPIIYHKVLYHTTLLCLSYKSLHHLISQEFLQLKAKSGHMAGHRTYYQEFNDGSYILYTQIAEFRVLEEPCKKKKIALILKARRKCFSQFYDTEFGKLFRRSFRTTLRLRITKGTKKCEKLSATYNIRLKRNEIALSNLSNYNPSFFG